MKQEVARSPREYGRLHQRKKRPSRLPSECHAARVALDRYRSDVSQPSTPDVNPQRPSCSRGAERTAYRKRGSRKWQKVSDG